MRTVVVQSEQQSSRRRQSRSRWSPARGSAARYGAGDTAVHALQDVSVEVTSGKLTAVMGPSGLGQVDADAHLRRPRQADRG